jgi:hypothetical protein
MTTTNNTNNSDETDEIELKKLIKLFFMIDFGVIIFTALQSNFVWFINTQFAFFSSLFITFASYLSYKNFINKNVSNIVNSEQNYQERDSIDKMDDPYDLYDEDIENNIQDENNISENNLNQEDDFAKIVKEEKQNLKKNSFKNTFRGLGAYSSIYRIMGYVSLVVGFLYLNNHHLLHTVSYLFGLFIVPFSATIYRGALN